MPMNFPDLDSLQRVAKVHGFREIKPDEKEDEYRNALADHVASRDFIESQEIRHKVGWDKWDEKQKRDMLARVLTT